MNVSHFPLTPHAHQLTVLQRLLDPFPVIRFMNWQQINRTQWDNRPKIVEWRDLPHVGAQWRYSVGPWGSWEGVPLVELIRLANKLRARPWICVPDTASDEMISRLVAYVIEGTNRRPILEFSNEIWNPIFLQHHHAAEQGANLADKPFQAALRWQAAQTRKLAAAAQGSADVVVCGQFFNEWVLQQLLEGCGDVVTALGVAPYLGRNQRGIEADGGDWRMREMDELAAEISAEIDSDLGPRIASFRQLADRYGIQLFAYEGGLHQVARNDRGQAAFETEKAAFMTFNRATYAGNVTLQLWETWRAKGGDVACPYSLLTPFDNQNTFFGHCEIHGDEIRMLSKYLGARAALQTEKI